MHLGPPYNFAGVSCSAGGAALAVCSLQCGLTCARALMMLVARCIVGGILLWSSGCSVQ